MSVTKYPEFESKIHSENVTVEFPSKNVSQNASFTTHKATPSMYAMAMSFVLPEIEHKSSS